MKTLKEKAETEIEAAKKDAEETKVCTYMDALREFCVYWWCM